MEVAAVLPNTSQPLEAPSISEPTTEPTDTNCGRAMEPPQCTVMVKDIHSGSSSGSPQYLIAVGSTIYFRATDGTNGSELWKSDGTSSGTVMVKDISSGSSSSSPGLFAAIGSTLFFSASDQTNGYELWKSDGTPSRHSNGQGYQQRKLQQWSHLLHSRWQHPLFP